MMKDPRHEEMKDEIYREISEERRRREEDPLSMYSDRELRNELKRRKNLKPRNGFRK